MNLLSLALLCLLCALPPHPSDRDELPAARRARLELVASAIADASEGDRRLAAALVVVAEDANAFARYVGEGRCRDGQPGARCSGGTARGYFDLTRDACPELWVAPPELPQPGAADPEWSPPELPEREVMASAWALETGARCAARALRVGFVRCGRSRDWPSAFKLYATGWCHDWPGQLRRAAKFRWMSARLLTRPTPTAIRDSIEQLCEREGCSPEVEAAAIEALHSEPPGGFGGLTADQAAQSLIEHARQRRI